VLSFTASFALAVAMSSPASAATTYTPDAGAGDQINFIGSNIALRVVPVSQTINCPTFTMAGAVVSPSVSRLYGANGADIATLTSGGCTNPLLGPTAVTKIGTWGLTITGDASGTTWPAKLTNVVAQVAMLGGPGCTFTIGGDLSGTFNTTTQKFTPGGSTIQILTAPVGGGCTFLGLAISQDVVVSGTWTNIPPVGSGPLTIVNP